MTFVICGVLVQVTPDMITSRGGVILTVNQVVRENTVAVRAYGYKLPIRVKDFPDKKVYDEEDIVKMCGYEVGTAWTMSPILALVKLCNKYPADASRGQSRWKNIRSELYGSLFPRLPNVKNDVLKGKVRTYEAQHGTFPNGMWESGKLDEMVEEAEAVIAEHGSIQSKFISYRLQDDILLRSN